MEQFTQVLHFQANIYLHFESHLIHKQAAHRHYLGQNQPFGSFFIMMKKLNIHKHTARHHYLRQNHPFGYIFHDDEEVEPGPDTVVILHGWQHKAEVMDVLNVLLLHSLKHKIHQDFSTENVTF